MTARRYSANRIADIRDIELARHRHALPHSVTHWSSGSPRFFVDEYIHQKTGHKGTFVPILMRLAGVPERSPA
ncbi:hypothetical protein [Ralstonia solanacearum]|uniref:hypothetical protein n=1 Tax=Ralstonia solanacearum TaxID=305 RepID=UPI0013C37985|nr:hypothetical protein [Ralstonia solanacearum]